MDGFDRYGEVGSSHLVMIVYEPKISGLKLN
jgi:hypothetical protein